MAKAIRYKLEVNLSIAKEEWNGPGKPDTNEGYWQSTFNNERLTVNESLILGTMDFMEMMKVLGQLHEAVKAVKQ